MVVRWFSTDCKKARKYNFCRKFDLKMLINKTYRTIHSLMDTEQGRAETLQTSQTFLYCMRFLILEFWNRGWFSQPSESRCLELWYNFFDSVGNIECFKSPRPNGIQQYKAGSWQKLGLATTLRKLPELHLLTVVKISYFQSMLFGKREFIKKGKPIDL